VRAFTLTPHSGQNPDQEPPRPRHPLIRIAGWIWLATTLLSLVSLIAVPIVINSAAFHNYVLKTVREQASESLGVPVQLQNYTLHFSTLSVDLYGLTVSGAAPYADPPLLQVRHAQAGVRIVSIFRRKWYLDNVQVDQPVVQIYVDKNGKSNLPTPKSSNSKSTTTIWDLGIRRTVLNHGEVYYNDRPIPLSVDLHDLDLHATFNEVTQQYAGTLSYADGRILYGAFQPFAHNLNVQFDATPAVAHIDPARISAGATQIVLSATATNYSNPQLDARYDITLDGAQLARVMHNSSIPTGFVKVSGTAQYHATPNQPALSALIVNGDLSSRELAIKASSTRATVSNIAAHYSLANGDAKLRDFRASLLGGEVTAQGTMKNISGNSHSELKANVHGVSLAAARSLLGAANTTPNVALTGVLNADATATWGKTFDDLIARADATINAQAAGHQPAAASQPSAALTSAPEPIPVNSAIHAVYTGSNQQVTLSQSYLRTPQTTLTMNGTVGKRSSLAVHLQANDLREVATIAGLFETPAAGKPAQPLDLAGSASFQGNIQGSTSAPHITGQLAATSLHFNGTDWKTVRTNIDASPSRVSLQNADLEPQSRGRITLNASAGLTKWSLANTSPIDVDLDASQLNIAELEHIAGQQIPVTGTLSTHVTLHGTELSPVGHGTLALTKVTAYDEPVNSVHVDFSGTGDETHANLSVQLPAGTVQGQASVRLKEKTYTAQLESAGIQLDQLAALKAKKIDARGTVSLHATGQGTFDNPQATATLEIPSLAIEKQTIEAIHLQADVTNHIANATLTSSAIHTSINAKAHIQLTGDYDADATLDTQGIPLQPLLATYAPEEADSVTGDTEVHATLHGPLKDKNRLEGHVTLPYLRVAYNKSIQLAATSPLHLDYKDTVLNIQRGAIRGTDTDLQFQGTIPTVGDGPMSLLLQGTVNLQLAQLFDPDIRTSGELKFNINSNGTGPNIGGEIDVVDASYASADLPVGLQHGNGVLTLTSNRINIKSFQGTVGGGTVIAQGGVAYRPSVQFDLGLRARNVRLLYPQGMRENLDADIRLAGSTDNANLGGTVNVADVSFTPGFDLNEFVGQFSGVESPPSRGFSQNVNLNLAVHSTNNVNLVSRTLSVNGAANLQVRGTAADPVILGRVTLNNGDIILNGTRFLLTGGTVQFVNPSQTEPVLNVSVSTSIQQYNIDLHFRGPVEQLQTQYNSDPALPQADIINLLAFGQTTEASAAVAPTPTNQAAESLVASQVASQVSSRVSKIAGISQLSINPVLASGTSQGPPGANITIQQRVTGNLFITFSSNVASTQSQVIQGQYQVTPRVAVSATRDPNGGFAVDTIIKKSW
jgi:translocation and assembly module TamB